MSAPNAPSSSPLDQAARLFPGTVMHARLSDAHHRFTYSVVSLLIDLDRLDDAAKQSPLFGINRFAPVSFQERDHGAQDGTRLRDHADGLLREAGIAEPAEKLLLLCYPRILGYAFNPISIYFAYDSENDLTAVIYEVRNTFGDMHTYVIPVADEHRVPDGVRQGCLKTFYVSPFMNMAQRYHFRLKPPGESVQIRILETDPNGPSLSATFSGQAAPLDTPTLMRTCLRRPWMSAKVTLGIHWEALKLFFKGAKFHHRRSSWTGYSIITGDAASAELRRPREGVDGPQKPIPLKPATRLRQAAQLNQF